MIAMEGHSELTPTEAERAELARLSGIVGEEWASRSPAHAAVLAHAREVLGNIDSDKLATMDLPLAAARTREAALSLLSFVAMSMMMVYVALIAVNVVLRYVLGNPVGGIGEVSFLLIPVAISVCVAVGTGAGMLIALDMISARLAPRPPRWPASPCRRWNGGGSPAACRRPPSPVPAGSAS